MIYVCTGTHPVPFDRLIHAMEDYAGTTPEKVIIQAGTSQLPIHNAEHLTFISWEEALGYIKSARLVISHAGTGTLLDTLTANIPTIVWPRLAQFGEAANDHQIEIATVLSKQGRVRMVNTAEELFSCLNQDTLPRPKPEDARAGGLRDALRESLTQIRQKKR